ncbi:MAG: tetratricopeptide repeat protein [Verrucomicrobiota bacterium JB025]|nr:tetratricopeptide repeat protein [Verrucomicrobiota bacterium JB025]
MRNSLVSGGHLRRLLLRVLPAVLLLQMIPAAAEPEPTAETLRKIVALAQKDGKTPDGLEFYPRMKQEIHAELSIREGDLDFTENLKFTRKVSGTKYLVFEFASDNFRGSYSTDIIATGDSPATFRRWRLLPDGRIARLTGVMNLNRKEVPDTPARTQSSATIVWQGIIEKAGQPTGEQVLAHEYASEFRMTDWNMQSHNWHNTTLSGGKVLRRELVKFNDSETSEELPATDRNAADPPGQLANSTGGKQNPTAKPQPATPGEYTFKDKNFAFTHPDGSYVKMNANLVNPDASLALTQHSPNRLFMIIAEDVGTQSQFAAETMVEIVRTNLQSSFPDVELGKIGNASVSGLKLKSFSSKATLRNGQLASFCHMITVTQGFAYQFMLLSNDRTMHDLTAELEKLIANFRILDPNMTGAGLQVARARPYHVPAFGIHFDPAPFHSLQWDSASLTSQFPAAEYGTLTTNGGGLIVIPLDLGDLDPDQATLTTVLRTFAGLAEQTDNLAEQAHTQGSATGTKSTAEYEFQRSQYTHQVRVLRNGASAVAISAFAKGVGPGKLAEVETMLDAVRISPPEPSAEPRLTSPRDAELINTMGLLAHQRGSFRTAIPFYEAADKRDPENPVYLQNILQAHQDAGLSEQALTLLDARLADTPDPAPALLAFRASLLSTAGRTSESADVYRKLFASQWRDDNHFQNFLGVLITLGETENAAEAVDRYIDAHSVQSLRVLRWQHQVHAQAGHHAKALKLARALADTHPSNPTVSFDLVIALIDAEHHDEALALLDRGNFDAAGAAELLYQRGRALSGKREYRKARECFEQALSSAPDDPMIREALAIASAMLGQGDQESIRHKIDAVPVPQPLRDAIAGVRSTAEPGTGFPYRIESSLTGIHYQPGEPLKRSEYLEVSIHTRPGVEQFKNVVFNFDPTYERACVNELTVLDASGNVVATGNPDDYYVSGGTGGTHAMATGERTVTAPVPGLRPGHTLRYCYTVETKSTPESPPFDRFLFGSLVPAGPRAVFLTGSPGAYRSHSENGDITEVRGDSFRYWLSAEPTRFELENLLPDLDRFLPSLALGPTAPSWQAIGTEYLAEIGDRLTPTAEIRTLTSQLTRGKTTESARLNAILSFVQTELTYQAIEFGRRARIPLRAGESLGNRYGDCKDHSLLAHLLLESAGIHSQLALVHNNSAVHPDLPSLDQFNHMIIRVGNRETGTFYDCTGDHIDPGLGVSAGLQGRQALVLHPAGPALESIPVAGPDLNHITAKRDLHFNRDTNEFTIDESIRFQGEQAQWLKTYLSSTNPAEHANTLVRILGTDHRLRIDKVTVDGLRQPSQPLVVTMKYRLTRALHPGQGTLAGPLPAVWENFYFNPGAIAERRAPFKLFTSYVFESECRLHLDGLPATAGTVWENARRDSPWTEWTATAEPSGQLQTLHARMTVKRGTFPAGDFANYHQSLGDFLDAIRGRISVKQPDNQ